ncbi:ClpX C4-type zinc finger protein [Serratia sp. JSRIV004]|uniref:ClpX C4-type zinc finger protein n=1 Tax=unclassified Serratia (in: enterobacteria) TaxID=2647522 RepID=UPI003530213D|nr:hypothetical protein KGP26_00625 [Serratia sp. JSRIV002]UAN57641.1 hypothetical protein KGP21_00625 [Serratia sp. JSRIV004]
MKDVAYCSFCGKSNAEVAHLIAGPKVCICDGCISLSCKIIHARSEMEPKIHWRPKCCIF